MRRRAGRPGPAHGGARPRLSGLQGGVVRGRHAPCRALPCRAVRRTRPRQVHGSAAAARRVHPGEADGRLPGRRGRGQPGPAGAPGGPRLGLGAGLGVHHGQAHRGPDRVLHVDVRAVPRPLRALDQEARVPPDTPQGRPTARPGRQVLVRVPAAHPRTSRTRLARPPRQAVAEDPAAAREGPRGAAIRPRRCPRTRHTAPGCTGTTSGPACAGRAPTRTHTRPCSSSRLWGTCSSRRSCTTSWSCGPRS